MDYVFFVIIILALVAVFVLLGRAERRTKNKYKMTAYKLLDSPNPSSIEILNTIKFLRIYGGRWRKDKEFLQLVDRLLVKLNAIEKK